MSPDNRCCQHCERSSEDHDLLIGIRADIKHFMEASTDHENRIRRAERWGFLAIGALFLLQALIGIALATGRIK